MFPRKLEGSFWGLTSYFNPAKYKNKIENYKKFREKSKEQGLKLLCVELAFGNEKFELSKKDADILIQVRSNSILWQKERLLNIGLKNLPEDCDKIAWLDCDILFKNNNWVGEACELLEKYAIVQLFSFATRLHKDEYDCDINNLPSGAGEGEKIHGIGYGISNFGRNFDDFLKHGHTGFAWAGRKEIFKEVGFYDKFILASSDSFMAHAFYNSRNNYIYNSSSKEMRADQADWKDKIYQKIRGSVYYASGAIFHLWHGNYVNRHYGRIESLYQRYEFDPEKDLKLNEHECWEWNSDKKQMHKEVEDYFYMRKEDEFNFKELNQPALLKKIPLFPRKLEGSFWGLTSYFNPAKYKNKIENYRKFREKSKEQGLKLLCVELAFGNEKFELSKKDADILIQVRSNSILWQKERLLNIGLKNLPEDCDKIAWLDCDILFKNDNWVKEACELLEKYAIIQLFSFAIQLDKNNMYKAETPTFGWGEGKIINSITYRFLNYPKIREDKIENGQSGFAWAGRKCVFDSAGFYDNFIVGSGDLAMAYAFYGRTCKKISFSDELREDYLRWICDIFSFTNGSVYYLDGIIFHLWHGNISNRLYMDRNNIYSKYEFDPEKDLKLNEHECWEWNSDKKQMHKEVEDYFYMRKEERG
jgi:predicted DNA binding CopG/RHH family protein